MRFPHSLTFLCLAGQLSGQSVSPREPIETVLDSLAHIDSGPLRVVPPVSRPDAGLRLTRRRVSIGRAYLHVQEHGTGIPLVLIPGGPGNTLQSFHPYFSRAAAFARVIYYDLRGTGQSSWDPEKGYTAEQAVADLDRLRAALGIDRWIVLGHSFGGLLAQLYAIHYPERTAGLVLVASSEAFADDFGDSDGRKYLLPVERARVQEVYTQNGTRFVPVHSERVDLGTMRLLVYNALRNGDWKRQYFQRPSDRKMAQIATHEWRHDRNFNSLLNQSAFAQELDGAFMDIPIPCLIVEGRWDPTWEPGKPKEFASHFPQCRLRVLDQSSHFPFAEEPNRFFSELERFTEGIGTAAPGEVQLWKRKIVRYRITAKP